VSKSDLVAVSNDFTLGDHLVILGHDSEPLEGLVILGSTVGVDSDDSASNVLPKSVRLNMIPFLNNSN